MPSKKGTTPQWVPIARDLIAGAPTKVLTYSDLASLLTVKRSDLQAPASLTVRRFITTLTDQGVIRSIDIAPDELSGATSNTSYRTFTRYVVDGASPYAVALSLRSNSYLSHASAVFLHGLTVQVPKTIYANKEQSAKPTSPSRELTQEGIDRAFRNAARVSNYVFRYGDYQIVLLSGKNTRRLEVTEVRLPSSETVAVTKLERTLIDIVVRPTYAGGVFEVLEAFKAARDRVSTSVLTSTLRKLDYAYPYHQAIGFYMQRAGYSQDQLSRLASFGMGYDFYLSNKAANMRYDSAWRVHYPEGL